MYKEVAFDPSSLVSMEYYNLVKQHFGFEHGRYISADIKSWAREAMEHVKISPLQEIKKKSIQNYLNKLGRTKKADEFCLAKDRKSIQSDRWSAWFRDQVAIRPFSFAISESKEIECVNVDAINGGNDQWIVDRSLSVNRSTIDLFKVLEPLIKMSDEITLIDQYFRLSDNKNLAELFRISSLAGIKKVSIVTSMETPNATDIYERECQALNAVGFDFNWIKAPDRYFHDRYFITDIGAIRSGHGFMTEAKKGAHADMTNLSIIGKVEADRTLKELAELLSSNKASVIFSA